MSMPTRQDSGLSTDGTDLVNSLPLFLNCFVHLSLCLSVRLFESMSNCHLSFCLSVCLSVCPSVCPSLYLVFVSIELSIYPSNHQ